MRKSFLLSLIFLAALAPFAAWASDERAEVDYVNPFICTQGDHGEWHPAATRPFGAVNLGPDTYPGSLIAWGGAAHGGYDWSDSMVRGFSHFKRGSSGGTRIIDRAGWFSILPFTGERSHAWYRTPMLSEDKARETASPGYYSTYLTEGGIAVELTADVHAGFHRYTFTPGSEAKILIYQGNRGSGVPFSCQLLDNQTIEGHVGEWWFYATFDHPVLASLIQDEDGFLHPGDCLEPSTQTGFICSFGDLEGQPLNIRAGISFTDSQHARDNYKAECQGATFDAKHEKAKENWQAILGRIAVESPDEDLKTVFYTALYHSCLLPIVQSDVDGTYLGMDNALHQTGGHVHYDGYAFWDTFRSKYQLYALLVPEIYRDIVRSLGDIYEQTDYDACARPCKPRTYGYSYKARGKRYVWPNCRSEHQLMVFTDAYVKGLCDLDLASVYPYIRKEALSQMPAWYDTFGYIPYQPDQTCEYSWDSWCVAYLARELGEAEDQAFFSARAAYWKNVWDPSIRFFRARAADGSWLDFPDDPTEDRRKYTYECTGWQMRWHSLHDVPSLIDLFGGRRKFLKELHWFFENNLYNAGNQPDLHTPFLFNLAGEPWETQKWMNALLTKPTIQRYGTHGFLQRPIYDRVYKATPDGYLVEMDDDYGCMASWFAMGAMGLFQLCPGQPVYQLFSPIFDQVTIHLENNRTLTLEAKGLSDDSFYIQSATFDGRPLQASHIAHETLMEGGTLRFELGPKPNRRWGK